MTDSADARPLVLVGVDGSESSDKALAWAIDYATRSGGALELLTAWHYLATYGYPIVIAGHDPEATARTVLEKAAAEVSLPPDLLRMTVVGGSPAQQLVEASAHADLLVVGTRGHGGFTGLLLGSVGAHCVHHAHCPVVVVRPAHIDPSHEAPDT